MKWRARKFGNVPYVRTFGKFVNPETNKQTKLSSCLALFVCMYMKDYRKRPKRPRGGRTKDKLRRRQGASQVFYVPLYLSLLSFTFTYKGQSFMQTQSVFHENYKSKIETHFLPP